MGDEQVFLVIDFCQRSGISSAVAVCFDYITCTSYRLIGTIKESKMA